MKSRPSPSVHPLDSPDSEGSANRRGSSPLDDQSSSEAMRPDSWRGAWFRVQLEPFWQRFLKRGMEEQMLDAAHFRVFFLLTTLMGSRNEVNQTQEEIAGLTRLKPSRVSEVLKDLESLGCIQRVGGRRKNAFIRIDPELVTRASRLTHIRAMEEWNEEKQRRLQQIVEGSSDSTTRAGITGPSGSLAVPF